MNWLITIGLISPILIIIAWEFYCLFWKGERDDRAMSDEPSAFARATAFNILTRHPDCIRDDVVLNELMDDIAAAIDKGRPSIPILPGQKPGAPIGTDADE